MGAEGARQEPRTTRSAYEQLGERYVDDAAVRRRDRRVREDGQARSRTTARRTFALAAALRPERRADEGRRAAAASVLRTVDRRGDVGRAGAPGDRSRGDDRHARRAREGAVAAVVHDGAQAGLSARARRALPALRAAAGRARCATATTRSARPRAPSSTASAATACSRCSRRCATRRTSQQQRVAVAVLGHLGNKGAAAPLVHMARIEPPKDDAPASARCTESARSRGPRRRAGRRRPARRSGGARRRAAAHRPPGDRDARGRDVHARPLRRQARGRAAAQGARRSTRPSVQALACLGLAQIDDPRVGRRR